MSNILKLVLRDHWFEEIKSGRKTHEYREAKPFWNLRLIPTIQWKFVEFQKAYRKNPEKMLFEIKSIRPMGLPNDLNLALVWDIELGGRVK